MSKSLYFILPKGFKFKYPLLFEVLRFIKNLDFISFLSFYFTREIRTAKKERLRILHQCFLINTKIDSPHTQKEILEFIKLLLNSSERDDGVFVECGSYKGSSTSKFSFAAKLANKKLYVFDSFEGIPVNNEDHGLNIYGEKTEFAEGSFMGTLDEVKNNVRTYGSLENCQFIKGWFRDTLPEFNQKVLGVYLDVDLESSTRTCLKCLYPLLVKGGRILSQDGHLPLIIDLFGNRDFWIKELDIQPPLVYGLGTKKLIYFIK